MFIFLLLAHLLLKINIKLTTFAIASSVPVDAALLALNNPLLITIVPIPNQLQRHGGALNFMIIEPRHEKNGFLQMRKQRRRSASR